MAREENTMDASLETLTVTEVMAALKAKDRDTIYRLRATGRLRAVKIGREWRFPRQEFEAFLRGEPQTAPRPARPRKSGLPVWARGLPELVKR
jgi:excisionase family DNA binding protein